MNDKQKKEQFLLELEELSRKYGLIINGCGCCDSPHFIDDINEEKDFHLDSGYKLNEEIGSSEIHWISKDDFYWRQGHRPLKKTVQ